MQEADLHDLSDDSDYTALQQQESTSSVNSGRMSDSSESEVVYSKENVAVHPSQYAAGRISGRLRIIKQGSSFFLTWIPYKATTNLAGSVGRNLNSNVSDKERNLYTIKPISLTDIHSIRRHIPALGWQYIIIVLSSGLAFAPLYFYNGGVREFFAILKQHVFVVRSPDDSNVFLLNDFQDPLQKSLSSLELPRVLSVVNGAPMQGSPNEVSSIDDSMTVNGIASSGTSTTSEYSGRQRHKTHDPTHDLSIHVLEKFSLVTKLAREATTQLFREFHDSHDLLYDRKQKNSSPLDAAAVSLLNDKPNDAQSKADDIVASSDSTEFDKLSLVWGKPRQPPLTHEEWVTFLDSEGRIMDSKALIKRIFYGGLEHKLRKEVWKFLLGYYEYESTYAEREYLELVRKTDYETIKSQWKSISEVQARRFTKFRERRGLIDKDVVRTDRSVPYFEGDDNPNVRVLHDILLTYSFYNFDLGYCQGMSDLLSPILYVMRDESEAFWSFVALMDRLGPNFNRDQSGMHSQLFALSKLVELLDHSLHNYFRQADCLNYFFCFRWILIQFKREFEYEKVMRLWEVLWTHYPSEHLHLYLCVAILKSHKKKIMEEQMDFDTLLKFINGLSNQIDLDSIIRDAEALCVCAGENGAACIPPGTPPSCPADSDAGLCYAQQDDEIL
ncbi:TBC1 domain family member 15 [Phalaenopsis equestris]|uniref:TBC1 domain family member 15 n=1 Tax=Phalaenopsis equestris TaxID=78828 RepID=UPI0009E5ADEF|nr:TBC1 domain family member 15 [Phalaenopsis equestris]